MPTALDGPWVIDAVDGVITAVDRDPDREQTVDADCDLTAVPGFIDCHEHIGIDVGDEGAQARESHGEMLIKGVANLRAMLEGGVTTIRDCGERPDVEPVWIDALRRGVVPGPRVLRSVSPIARTGGHAWYISRQTDGEGALRARVRENLRDGADFIKFMASGGIGTVGSDQSRAEYTPHEVAALVDEAHRLGMRVAAHGHGGQGVTDAVLAGIDTLEHGALLTDDQLHLLREHDVVLIVTMAVAEAYCTDPRVPPSTQAFMPGFYARALTMLPRARAAGVSIALGSDCVHGGIAAEMRILVDSGYTAFEAMEAATLGGARALGRDDLGRIAVGCRADLLLLDGDPTIDHAAAAAPVGVLLDGRWQYRAPAGLASGTVPA